MLSSQAAVRSNAQGDGAWRQREQLDLDLSRSYCCYGNCIQVTLAAGRCFSGLSPLDDDDVCLSRDWPLLGQSGLDDIILPEAGRGGKAEPPPPPPLSMLGGVRPRGGPGGAEEGGGGWSIRL